jgi:hypothetical protein
VLLAILLFRDSFVRFSCGVDFEMAIGLTVAEVV